jgi:DNA-binding NarL/FixJ family response regulator
MRLAIVEDDLSLQQVFRTLFTHSGQFELVGIFGSGELAIAHLPVAEPDVVLMDIDLPGINGIECVRYLRDKLPHTQFMILTVTDNSNKIFDALKAGASGYLLKTELPSTIMSSIIDLHNGGSPMSRDIARMVVNAFHAKPVIEKTILEKETPMPIVSVSDEPDMSSTMIETHLTDRERQILQLLAAGVRDKEIAEALNLSIFTIQTHLRSVYKKLHVRSRVEAALKYKDMQ